MKPIAAAAFGFAVVLVMSLDTRAMVDVRPGGAWPDDWPKALEPLRAHARTIGVASGTQEDVYEITFADRAEFERAWPAILSLKTPGAPLRLFRVGPLPAWGLGQLESNAGPTVRIYGPPPCETFGPDGQPLKSAAPWPKELIGPHGELPEFVRAEPHDGRLRWVAVDPAKDAQVGFHYRARVDVDLVVDGKVIDLNRVPLPSDGPVVDRRF